METLRGKYTENKWKSKLKIAKAEKKAERQSSTRHKKRYEKVKLKNKDLKKENENLKEEIEKYKMERIPIGQSKSSIKPNRHKYAVWIISLAIRLQVMQGLSYRQTKMSLCETFFSMGLKISLPCPSTIRQWVQKQSIYELKMASKQAELESQVLIIDESAGIGQEKAFLVLGVEIDNWKETPKSLEHSDMQVLGVGTRKSWNAENIKKVLGKIKKEHLGKIKYVISDGATVMRKGCKLSKLTRVLDCTHWMANCMERYYKKDEGFIELQKHLGIVRQKMVNGSKVWMIAPSMRTKARFLNLFAIVEWMGKIENVWKSLKKDEKEAVSFIKEQPELVRELICIIKIIKELSTLLKIKGITAESAEEVRKIFIAYLLQTKNIKQFEADMLKYIEEIRTSLPNETRILCCSDVIESYFGKFKNRGNKAASQGITEDILTLSLFNNQLTDTRVQEAMESTAFSDIALWASKNTVDSFSKTKQKAWRKVVSKIA